MSIRAKAFLSALAPLLLAAAAWCQGAALASGVASGGAVVVPDTFLRGYDPVTVTYDRELGPAKGPGPADGPGEYLDIRPAVSGEYRWLDARTIQFLPARPWPALSSFKIRYKGGESNLMTMISAPSSIEPGPGSADLEPVSGFALSFASPLAADELAKMIKIEVRDLPGVEAGGAKWIVSPAFTVRELEAARSKNGSAFSLRLRESIPYGKRIILHLSLSLDPALPDSIAEYSFSTRKDFRLVAMGSSYGGSLPVAPQGSSYSKDQALDCGTESSELFLEFSETIQPVSVETLKRLVRFEPEVRNLRASVSGSRLALSFEADRASLYKLNVAWQSLRSATGRELSRYRDSSFWFFYRQATPFLSWRAAGGVVERYGPQLLPMEGRGLGRVDLRVYKIDPESPNFWPYPNSPIAIAENSRPPMPGEEPAEGQEIAKQLRLLGSPEISKIVDLPIGVSSGRTNFGIDLKTELATKYGKDAAGTYLVGYRTLDAGDRRSYVRLVVTDLCLTTVEEEDALDFVVTSLRTGEPLAGVRIRVDGYGSWSQTRSLSPIFSGTTDQTGQFRYVHRKALSMAPARVVVSRGEDVLVLDPRNPPPAFADNHWSSGSSSWLDWLSYDPREERHVARTKAWLLSERPVYRPEETVHLLGWVRDRKDGEILRYAGGEALELYIQAEGKDWTFPAQLSGLGRFSLEFKDAEAPTGAYRALLRGAKTKTLLAQVDFRKESYRVPSFKVDISGPDRVGLDKAFQLELSADYYSGGRVVGEAVTWTVTQYPYSISSPSFPGYLFSTDERFSSGLPFSTTGSIQKEEVLDESGSSRLRLDPSTERDGRARRYMVEATVQGADRQTVTQTKQVLALPPFSIGLKVERFLTDKTEIAPSLIVLDATEKPLAGKKIGLRLYQRQWHSYIAQTDFTTGDVRYVTDVVDQLVGETSALSLETAVTPSFKVKEAGVYVVEAFATDELGRRVFVKADLFLAGPNPVSWQRSKSELFEMAADKGSYAPGQKVRLLLKSPFNEGWALVVAEGPAANEYRWVRIADGQGICELTADADMAPGFPVTALLERGRVPGTGASDRNAKIDLGRPTALASSLWVRVLPVANQAQLALSHATTARPGTDLAIDLSLKDPDGKPLDGEVALWVVDKAVLALGKEASLDALSPFIERARSYLRLRDTRNLTLGALPVEEVPGGDGGDLAAALADLMNKTTVRKNFQTVPYFNPSIPVKDGVAHIVVSLPDNLTDFAVRAVAVSGFDRFASAKSAFSVRLPVLVQTALPRFVRPGDSFSAGGIGRVTEGEGGPALAGIKVEGLKLEGSATGELARSFTLDAKKAVKLLFPLIAPLSLQESGEAKVSASLFLQRNSDGARDAFKLELPVHDDVAQRRVTSLVLADGSTAISLLDAPLAPRAGSLVRTLIVAKDPRLLKVVLGLEFLSGYVHGCLEQRVSKLYPSVGLKSLVAGLGIAAYAPRKEQIPSDFFSYLASCQDGDGLYAYWPGSIGYVSLTAYVVEFLVQVRAAGVALPEDGFNRAVSALKQALRSDYARLYSNYALYERVEALAALDAAGVFDSSYAAMLLDAAPNLQCYSQARLLSVLLRHGQAGSTKVKDLVKRLEDSVVTKSEAGRILFAGLQDKSLPWGGPTLSSETLTLAAMTEALTAAAPNDPKTAMLGDQVLAACGDHGWAGTRDTVAALRALASLLSGAPKGGDFALTLRAGAGAATRRLAKPGAQIASFPVAENGPVSLQVLSGATKAAPLGLLMLVDYKPAGRGANIAAENSGFALNRELVLIGSGGSEMARYPASSKTATVLALDSVVEERAHLVNFQDGDFVAVTVPLAAGLEPLNPQLAGAPPEATPSSGPTLAPTYTLYLDDRVVYYYNRLPKGNYDFAFRARASFEGSFTEPQALAELMYDLSVRGLSEGSELRIGPTGAK